MRVKLLPSNPTITISYSPHLNLANRPLVHKQFVWLSTNTLKQSCETPIISGSLILSHFIIHVKVIPVTKALSYSAASTGPVSDGVCRLSDPQPVLKWGDDLVE